MVQLGPISLDTTVNLPTIITLVVIAQRVYNWYKSIRHKIDTMWEQFLVEHPEHERREFLRISNVKRAR